MKYISDIIPQEKIATWKQGDRILISAATGSGKTEFVFKNLYEYCKKRKKRILLFLNRIILKEQLSNKEFDKTVTIRLYQSEENTIIRESYNDSFTFEEYDYIVFDEAHYFMTDSDFSTSTDLLLKLAMRNYPEKTLLFITATPENLVNLNIIKNTIPPYVVKRDTSFIKNLYFYRIIRNNLQVIRSIVKSVPEDSKLIYFGNAEIAFTLAKEFEDSTFLCADTNRFYGRYYKNDEKDIKSKLAKTEKFDKKYLFTTRVLDNGVSLNDRSIKYVIIDDSIDPIVVLQMLGRKRILDENDTINLYIRDHALNAIKGKLKLLENEILRIEEYNKKGKQHFLLDNKKKSIPRFIDTDGSLNIAKVSSIQYKHKIYKDMTKLHFGYKEYICRSLNYSLENSISANQEYRELQAKDVLEKYSNRKLYKEEQIKFKIEFLVAILDSRKDKPVGLHTLSGILTDNNLPYFIDSRQERDPEKEGGYRRYWIIMKM